MCDLAYAIQAEQIERRQLAEMTLAPHVEESGSILTPEAALEEFRAWLVSPPADLDRPEEERELFELIGVR